MILTRFISTDYGTFGKLYVGDKSFYTVEKPWANNTPYESCIPSGEYTLEPHNSLKYGDALFIVGNGVEYQDSDTAKRFACLIHVANYEADVVGCIGLGDKYLGHMVTNSKKAIKEFYELCDPQKEHKLIIEWGERGSENV
jgi:hypothetical protein